MVDLLLLSQFVRVDEVLRCYSTFVKRLMRHFENLFIFLSSKENNKVILKGISVCKKTIKIVY